MEKHKAIVKGIILGERYEAYSSHTYYSKGVSIIDRIETLQSNIKSLEVTKHKEKIDLENIWTGELDLPLLNRGDKLYIFKMDIEVVIKERIRTTESNTFIYVTDHVIRTIDNDEEAEESREIAENEIARCKKGLEEMIEKIRSEEEESECIYREVETPKNNQSWLSRLFK